MHVSLSIAVYPSDDHVAVGHLSVGRQSEADPSCCVHTDGKSDILVSSVEAPVELVVSTPIHDLAEAILLCQLTVGSAEGDCEEKAHEEQSTR